jgi:hypothetical protein
MDSNELKELGDLLDPLDIWSPRKETLLEPSRKTPIGMFESPSEMQRHQFEREAEKSRKWLEKNYPRKPKEPRQLKQDPDSGTFI